MDFNKYHLRLIENSTLAFNGSCIIWQGATKGSIPGNYGVMNITFLDGKRSVMHTHRIRMSIEKRTIIDKQYDVSHLCHNRQCVNIEHLSEEPHYVNNNRQHCKALGECTEHHPYPKCMLDLIMKA